MTESFLSFIHSHPQWLIGIAFTVAFVESLIIIGFMLPGWVLLLALGGVVASTTISFMPVWLAVSAGALCGEALGFYLGKWNSRRIMQLQWMRQHVLLIQKAQHFFERYGALALILGRFIGPVRAVLPFVAGLLQFSSPTYWLINISVAPIWALAYLLPGVMAVQFVQVQNVNWWPLFLHAVVSFLFLAGGHFFSNRYRIGYLCCAILFIASLLLLPFLSSGHLLSVVWQAVWMVLSR